MSNGLPPTCNERGLIETMLPGAEGELIPLPRSERERSTMKRIIPVVCGGVGLVVLVWVWYCWAADYGYGAVSGTYRFDQVGEHSTLVLQENREFRQEIRRPGAVERSQGTWRRIGEGGIVFSKEFLKVAGQNSRPDGQVDGEVRKAFWGGSLSIVFGQAENTAVFHKNSFR